MFLNPVYCYWLSLLPGPTRPRARASEAQTTSNRNCTRCLPCLLQRVVHAAYVPSNPHGQQRPGTTRFGSPSAFFLVHFWGGGHIFVSGIANFRHPGFPTYPYPISSDEAICNGGVQSQKTCRRVGFSFFFSCWKVMAGQHNLATQVGHVPPPCWGPP